MKKITVIVPARNEEKTIRGCIESIIRDTYPDKEIVFIDDGSTDATPEILKEYEGKVKTLRSPGKGPSFARNLAIAQSSGEFIAFTDADCTVGKEWLKELISGFRDESVWSVGGCQLVPPDEGEFARKVGDFFAAFSFVSDYIHKTGKMRQVRHSPTCNVMYRREIFNRLGGFRVDLWPCEDLEFDIRGAADGYKMLCNERAVVYHHRPSSFHGFVKMLYRYGKAHSKLNIIHGFTELIHYVPLSIAFLIALNLSLLGCLPAAAAALDLVLLFAVLLLGILKVGSLKRGFNSSLLLFAGLSAWTIGYFAGAWSQVQGKNESTSHK